jgi:DNA-binding LytR/AlgR family response regulator
MDDLLHNLGLGKRLKLNTRTGFMVIDPRDIVCCIADGNYTEIVMLNDRKEIVSSNLGSIEKELDGDHFFRISRSALVNLNYLTHVENKNSRCRLQSESVIELKVARNRLGKLENKFARLG